MLVTLTKSPAFIRLIQATTASWLYYSSAYNKGQSSKLLFLSVKMICVLFLFRFVVDYFSFRLFALNALFGIQVLA